MKLLHLSLWSIFLIVCVSQCESDADSSDVCNEDLSHEVIVSGPSSQKDYVNKDNITETLSCRLYPTSLLNCSWSWLHTLQEDAQFSVHISICVNDTTFHSWNISSKVKEGSWSHFFHKYLPMDVLIQFNISLPNTWTTYTYMFDRDAIVVLAPPSNVSASVKDGRLLVTWNPPGNMENAHCFDYELDMGNQENIIHLSNKLSYTELNDPTRTYKVRIRTKKSESCLESPEWSEWSHTVTVEQSVDKLNMLVIISISLGIPMILLAVLLLLRHQRLSQLLFPQIPRPPPKYIHFLEKSDLPNFFYPAQTKTEEEITQVEDIEDTDS